MTALDTNVLVAVLVATSSRHLSALAGLEKLNDQLCTTPTNIGETLRILTHAKVFEKPLKLPAAVSVLSSMIESYRVRLLDEQTDWWESLPDLESEVPGLKGNEIFDARIALCLKSHGIKRIYTWDADFKKYSFLKPIQYL